MEVHFWVCVFIIHAQVIFYTNGQNLAKSSHGNSDDNKKYENVDKKFDDYHSNSKPLDFMTKVKAPTEHKDYFLPPIFPLNPENHDDNEEEDDDIDEDQIYLDYHYDTKSNYRDPNDLSTPKPDIGQSELLPFGGNIPVHSAKDDLPFFLLEPENTYAIKNKPAILKCKAANTLEIYFICNEEKIHTANFEYVHPQSGVRIIEGEYNITKENVEEYFGEKYECVCIAWTSRGQIRSQSATIELPYIKKQFVVTPKSQLVKQYNSANFLCEPPPAAPFAQVYWLKNGAPIVANDNIQISKEGHLFIKQASLLDMANYTCVAENIAGKRISIPALLSIFINGGWSAWSSWTECSCAGSSSSGRKRVRSCTAPRPLNGGQPCVGSDIQKTSDCLDCNLDMYVDGLDELADDSPDILLGRWSQWSEWSRCDSDCLQTRRRKCLISSACLGKDYQMAQCPLCVRTSKSDLINDGSSYWPLFIALSITFLVFIVVVVLGIKYLKFKMSDNSPYIKPSPGSNYFGSVIKRTLTNQPDLTIHEEFQTLNSHHTSRLTSTDAQRNEHLYEVPQLAIGYMTPLDQEVRANNYAINERNYACKENSESDRSDSSCFLSSGSSYGNGSIEISPSLKNNVSIESKFLVNTNNALETNISKVISSEGGWLCLDKCGVSLFVPDGAIDDDERELFSIEVTDDEWNRPILQEGETQLSPVLRCGSKNVHFRKGIILSFPHCASMKNSSWIITVLQKPEEINSRHWTKVLTLGQETQGVPIFAQIDSEKAYIVCEFLNDFVLIGKSFSALDSKVLRIGLFISKKLDTENACCYNLRIRVFENTPYAFYDCIESERRIGGSLLCDPKTVYFQDSCSDLCFNMRDIGEGWELKTGIKYYEISFSNIWNMNLRSVFCNYILHQIDPIMSLEINLSVFQKQKQSNCVNFRIKCNDMNSNYNVSIVKRLSSSSMDKNYTLNIIDNPFNFSSLTKKEGRYDFVYKGNRRSNVNIENEFCVLSKSDKAILCKLLDAQNHKGNDWRLLADKLKLNSYYYYFSNTCSPTENILNLWLCRSFDTNMLSNLSRIFREMSRVDCASIVERRCYVNK